MNQLFVNITTEEEKYDANFKSDLISKSSTTGIFEKLNREKFNITTRGIPEGYSAENAKDYYFVTNLIRQKSEEEALGGAHWVGHVGGYHVKMALSTNEKHEELASHEFGHWLNFPHPFEKINLEPPFITINDSQGGSKENFMDYGISRKSWYKLQLLNCDRTEKQ